MGTVVFLISAVLGQHAPFIPFSSLVFLLLLQSFPLAFPSAHLSRPPFHKSCHPGPNVSPLCHSFPCTCLPCLSLSLGAKPVLQWQPQTLLLASPFCDITAGQPIVRRASQRCRSASLPHNPHMHYKAKIAVTLLSLSRLSPQGHPLRKLPPLPGASVGHSWSWHVCLASGLEADSQPCPRTSPW